MEQMNLIAMIVFLSTGVLMIGLGIPMAARKIKQNMFYGARLKYTLMDEEIWWEVNARAGKDMIIIGIVLAALGIGAVFYFKEQPLSLYYLIGGTGVEMILIIVMTVRSIALSNKMAKEKGLK
jgi:uncharacterized membrane protein